MIPARRERLNQRAVIKIFGSPIPETRKKLSPNRESISSVHMCEINQLQKDAQEIGDLAVRLHAQIHKGSRNDPKKRADLDSIITYRHQVGHHALKAAEQISLSGDYNLSKTEMHIKNGQDDVKNAYRLIRSLAGL